MRYGGNPRKYRNVPEIVDGLRFDSRREARRYQELRLLEAAGMITDLCADKRQLHYRCVVNSELICTYTPDFRYREGGTLIIEDCKGVRTQVYLLKAKLVHALFGVTIREI